MRLGVLTGGGDVPGLNPCIKAIVNRACRAGHSVLGIRRGWGGLLNLNRDEPDRRSEWIMELNPVSVRTIDRFGGTFLHTSRTNPQKVRADDLPEFLRGRHGFDGQTLDCTDHILRNIEYLGIDALLPIALDRAANESFPRMSAVKR